MSVASLMAYKVLSKLNSVYISFFYNEFNLHREKIISLSDEELKDVMKGFHDFNRNIVGLDSELLYKYGYVERYDTPD